MKIIGLTGGIASGKSTAAAYLKTLGAPVFDSDATVHDLYKPHEPAWQAVKEAFGPDFFDGETLLRKKLGDYVFARPDKLAQLNQLVHPLVEKSLNAWLAARKAEKCPAVVLDVPLLFEIGWQDKVHEVWLVAVPRYVQLQRLMERDRLSPEQAEQRVNSQTPLEEKIPRAHQVIDTTGPYPTTQKKLAKLWQALA